MSTATSLVWMFVFGTGVAIVPAPVAAQPAKYLHLIKARKPAETMEP